MRVLQIGMILAFLLTGSHAWALTYVAASAIDEAGGSPSDVVSANNVDVDVPSGTTNGDVMFLVTKHGNTEAITATGWTALATDDDANTGSRAQLLCRVASSEPASYNISWATATRSGASIFTYRGSELDCTPDQTSNTSYETNDTNARGASLTTGETGDTLLFFGVIHISSSTTFAAATVPATFTQDTGASGSAQYSGNSRFGRGAASLVWSGSGVTGTMDSTISQTSAAKHAFVLAYAPVTGGGGGAAVGGYYHLQVVQ
jgi:hypothetical protein